MDYPYEKRFKKLFAEITISDPLKASEVFQNIPLEIIRLQLQSMENC